MTFRVCCNLLFAVGCASAACAAPRAVVEWRFGEAASKPWVSQAHQCAQVRVEEGVLKGVTDKSDPFLTSPSFSLSAKAGQVVEFRAKCGTSGRGEIYWIPAGQKGAQSKWCAGFDWIGDNAWHDYRVQPYWQGEKRIAAVRLDFVNGALNVPFELASMRIVDEEEAPQAGVSSWSEAALAAWRPEGGAATLRDGALEWRAPATGPAALVAPPLNFAADEAFIVAVDMAVDAGDTARLAWASDAVSGLHNKTFRVKPDGRFHVYNVDLSSEKAWAGRVVRLALSPALGKGARARVRAVRTGDALQGPADVSVTQARLSDAINRAGAPATLLVQLANSGGADATNLVLAVRSLPKGVRVCSAPGWERVPAVPASGTATHTLSLQADRPVSGTAEFNLSGNGADGQRVLAALEMLPDLKLPKVSYVPAPHPLASDYELGALYFPGWSKIDAWARIWPTAPERKPVLGWYDEANPEVVDWQIKWAVENGLSYFLVDWYWHKGDQHHDHWVKAFKQARYKSLLKWAVMWANHNSAGSHSEADQRAVTKFWIENYFNMPEYYRIDGKPVVMIWSPQNMERDLGPGGCKRLLDLSRQMAREAGYPDIWFVAMKWPEASWEPKVVQGLKDMGFDMTSIYHYMGHGGKAENPRRFSFDLVADSNAALWRGLRETGVLPFLPNLSTGWDDRPWHGDRGTEIYGRTAKDFRRICRDAKAFADETDIKRLCLGPLNEWGEGSYAEPCAQFGFGMYEAVRETFCREPKDGWPQNYGPRDVGLGPYDLPVPPPDSATDWTFANSMQGWSAMMGMKDCKTEDGLAFKTSTRDPALERLMTPFSAKSVKQIVVSMRVPAGTPGGCQLFWSSGGTPTEGTSLTLPLAADGKAHDYVFDVGANRAWRGRVARLRFDPCNASGVDVAVSRIRLVPVNAK